MDLFEVIVLTLPTVEFFDSSRPHMEQELLEPDDEFSSLSTTSFIRIPNTVLKACCGCTITAEELYKIDKTAMAEVLAEERKREEKPSVCIVPPEEEKGEEKAGEEDGGEEEGEDEAELSLELEEILKTCDAIQETTSHVGGEATVGGEEEKRETEEDSSKPAPYKTDLEYLEDNFQVGINP